MSIVNKSIEKQLKAAKAETGSNLEETFALHLRANRVSGWEREYRFHSGRKWRSDFAFPHLQILVEIEGGTKNKSRHTQAKGFEDDCRKYNTATIDGWRVLRFTADQIRSGEAISTVLNALLMLKLE